MSKLWRIIKKTPWSLSNAAQNILDFGLHKSNLVGPGRPKVKPLENASLEGSTKEETRMLSNIVYVVMRNTGDKSYVVAVFSCSSKASQYINTQDPALTGMFCRKYCMDNYNKA